MDYINTLLQDNSKKKYNPRYRPAVKQVLKGTSADPKDIARGKISKQGDIEDQLADAKKMISLLTSTLGRVWEMQTETKKNALPKVERDMIDYLFTKKSETITSADIDYSKDAKGTVDKLMDREAEIGKIVLELKGQ